MVNVESKRKDLLRQEDPFGFIRPEEYEGQGIEPSDIPPGTFAAQKHPPLLSSRFGGNAYGIGLFEINDRLEPEDLKILQSISTDNPDQIKTVFREINQIYKKIGLLIRFSSLGRPYYLIPFHLLSNSLTDMRDKADEIKKIIDFHRRKYLKESHRIGLLTSEDDPLADYLSVQFKQHEFIVIDTVEKLGAGRDLLDLVIIPRDICSTILMENFIPGSKDLITRQKLEKYALYVLGRIYKVLKQDGEIFLIANRYPLKTNRSVRLTFKTVREQKNFLIFTHIFKTKKQYQIENRSVRVNVFDLQVYLEGMYIDQSVRERLSPGRDLEKLSKKEIDDLPYLNFSLGDELAYDQQKVWPRFLSRYFDEIFHKPLIPDAIKNDWKKRFSFKGYSPDYMLVYLAQKKPAAASLDDLKKDVMESSLAGCPLTLLADYRNTFDFLIRTLNVLRNIRDNSYKGMPEIFMERLQEPVKNKRRRYLGLNHVLRLMEKVNRIERIESFINPDAIEGPDTDLLENLEILSLFGFSYGELREIFLIIVGHTTMGRILSGKMNEKTLTPLTHIARSMDAREGLNLIRYCSLMCMAETVASKRADMNPVQLAALFDLFDSAVRVVTNREMDWDKLLDEKISSMGGIHNKIIRRVLMMMNHLDFLDNWSELPAKGEMEKESLADYDGIKLARIENIISLIRVIEEFESRFLKDDPLQIPIFYRKFLGMEFHGTGHIFESIGSRLVFILLWLTVNVTRGEIINFNPVLTDLSDAETRERVKKMEEQGSTVNIDYLDLNTLEQLGEQLYQNHSAFIVNTGFRLRLDPDTQVVDIGFIDIDDNIDQLEILARELAGSRISEISDHELEEMGGLFSNLEDFYQGHERLLSWGDKPLSVPSTQKNWYEKVHDLRLFLKSSLNENLFDPENIYDDIERLYRLSKSILHFVLPEFVALNDLRLRGKIYLRASIIDHILAGTRKIQALIRSDRKEFQDIQVMHRLARREFGPMVAGTAGLNDAQVKLLEDLVKGIRKNKPLFDALVKSFVFQDVGLVPEFRDLYGTEGNMPDQAELGSLFLKKAKVARRYNTGSKAEDYLLFLVKHHDRILHIVRGEFSINVLQEIIEMADMELFDAFFVNSFVLFSALGEDLILEDLAAWLFRVRDLCHCIIRGETSLEEYLEKIYTRKGRLFRALEEFHLNGLPEGKSPVEYLESWEGEASGENNHKQAGKMITAMERIFLLRGIRYVDFLDLASLITRAPLRYIYRKKKYYGTGYATFEKDLFEAQRIFNNIQELPEDVRHFILGCLVEDRVRIFGFENVSIYLNYENLIKLLLIVLLGSRMFTGKDRPICLDFLSMMEKIDKRYEAVNDTINRISLTRIWEDRERLDQFFNAESGLVLKKDEIHGVLTVDFLDKLSADRNISRMKTISNVEQLKNYFSSSLQKFRKSPFYTDDYENQLEEAFHRRLKEVIDLMLDQAKGKMELLRDFNELHRLYMDLRDRSLETGFSEDQKHHLTDLYELRKDNLKREKLDEINALISSIHDIDELREYWDRVKYYLLDNREFLGKEFENLIANNFDQAAEKIKEMSFQVPFIS